MTIEAAIQAWWSATPDLQNKLNVSNVFTDDVPEGQDPPYVNVLISDEPYRRTTSGQIYESAIAFEVNHARNQPSAGLALAIEIQDSWKTFEADTPEVKSWCPLPGTKEKPNEDSGKHHWTVTNTVKHVLKG